ncbi:alpha/beta hydrolase family protein [Pontivivens ytuae]|uniref:Alpha/beta hydrolase n=1 Tax=Pontivivens ytuae TaxID=2789856 RepID=A0A7S9LT76_9RHOB|nr:alpha/beta hydrolase [Pontivivens ytuae]QPH54694.1 alpha/beta hydrolase [Pontivivens ytuae]
MGSGRVEEIAVNWRKTAVGGAAIATLALLLLWRLEDHDLDRRASEPFVFSVAGDRLAGTLWLPEDVPLAAVVLVHGDGPQDRTSAGGYASLINVLLDAGIAVASWDKPGVGESEGAWLDQSMANRAVETAAALAELQTRLGGVAIGALGFSQAGWVLPRLGAEDADFLVLVGPAVSWQQQGDYYTLTRLALEGVDDGEIERLMAEAAIADERVFGAEVFEAAAVPDGMSEARWGFIRRNRAEDARGDLAGLDVPLLAIWGEEDLNVDAEHDAQVYRDLVGGRHPANRVVVVPDATHGLLKAGPYNRQLVSEWSWDMELRFVLEGRHAFADGALEEITGWIVARD